MHMGITISFIVDTPIRTHSLIYKGLLNIFSCIINLFLSAPFFRK